MRNVTFINATSETFSPTKAGAAISMWVWEMCLAACRAGAEPLVVTKQTEAPPYNWSRTAFVPFPSPPTNPISLFLARVHRKLTGWPIFGLRTYVNRVAATLKSAGMESGCLVLHNDPEMAIVLRRLLPNAQIFLLFHNSNHYMRPEFRGSILHSATTILAVSAAAARAVETAYKLPTGSVKTLYNGVDLQQFHPAAHANGHTNGQPPIINFTGRLRKEKAPDLLLKAALAVSESNKNFSIQLLGQSELPPGQTDEYEIKIRELIQALESRGITIRQPGYVDRLNVAAEVRKADIHVTPSRKQEEFGLATIEAMASGLATIASRTGGTPEVVADAGLLFTSESVDELAAHLKTLIADHDLRANYARKALARAGELTWDHTWKKLAEYSTSAGK